MSRSFRPSILPITLLSAVVFAACGDAPFVAPEAPPEIAFDAMAANAAQPGSDDWIVVFKPGVADPPGLARRLLSQHGGRLRHTYQHTIQGFGASLPSQALNGIRNNPNVAYVEADGVVTIDGDQPVSSSLWGLDRIDESDLPLDSNYHYDFDGTGVDVYIIDTGIRTSHNEFVGRASPGFDYDNSPDGNDCNGHGTHVGGTVGGSTFGVAKNVNLIAVRVLSCSGSGTWIDVIAGVDWVTQQHQLGNQGGNTQPSVANMSLSGGGNTSLDNAVAASINAGVTYAVSAANYNTDACNYSPARLAAAVTVGSTTISDARSSFSNYGTCVDIFAPGSSILSAGNSSNSATSTKSGTSMSAPHVAGAAALLLEEDPSRKPTDVDGLLKSRATQNAISNVGAGSPNRLLCSLADCTESGGGGGGGPTQVTVDDVPVPTLEGRKHKSGTADIVVVDADGGSPSGVSVTVQWFKNDATSPSKTNGGVTTNGVATVTSGSIKGASTIAVCVVDLSGAGFDGTGEKYPVCSSNYGGGGGGGGGAPNSLVVQLTQKGNGPAKANLSWMGGGGTVDVYYRHDSGNASLLTGAISNTGSYTDNLGKNPTGTHSYQVCNAGLTAPDECSEEVQGNGL
jgi:subtilisin family serine protease